MVTRNTWYWSKVISRRGEYNVEEGSVPSFLRPTDPNVQASGGRPRSRLPDAALSCWHDLCIAVKGPGPIAGLSRAAWTATPMAQRSTMHDWLRATSRVLAVAAWLGVLSGTWLTVQNLDRRLAGNASAQPVSYAPAVCAPGHAGSQPADRLRGSDNNWTPLAARVPGPPAFPASTNLLAAYASCSPVVRQIAGHLAPLLWVLTLSVCLQV